MRRSRLILGWTVAVVALAGGCAQPGAAGGAAGGAPGGGTSDEPGEYLCQGTPVPAGILTDAGELRTHELMGIEWVDQTEDGSEGWMLWQNGDCALRYDLGGLGDAIVALDPDKPPDPASSRVHLLVTEVACASGKPADGRVVLERLAEHEDRVELVIGIEAQGGDQACPSNPPTPFTIELDEPLGDRTLLDVAVYPEQELAVAAKVS